MQVWFTFQDAPLALSLPGLEVESEALHNGGSKLDLSLWYWDDGDCIRGLVEYNTDLFDKRTAHRFAQHLTQVLRQVSETPRIRVGELSLLTDQDREMLRAQREQSTHPDELTSMHEAFFALAAAQPDRLGLTAADGDWSAGQLAGQADAIGSELQRLGVSRGDIVGV